MRRSVFLTLSLFLLTACGQTGPLYMPTEEKEPKPPVVESVDMEKAPQIDGATSAPVEAK